MEVSAALSGVVQHLFVHVLRISVAVMSRGKTQAATTPSDYLTDDERIAAYLEAVMEEAGDDPVSIAQALGAVARARNISQLARDNSLVEGLYYGLC